MYLKLFLSEIIETFDSTQKLNLIEPMLWMNSHCMVPYKIFIFVVDFKSKLVAITGHCLTLDPMEI